MTNTSLAAALFALGLTFGPGVAIAQHAHGHGAAVIELKLNNGEKWETDEALRTGMSRIRADLASSLPLIHDGRYSAADYASLADTIQGHVEYVTVNCKLAEEADAQLHVAIAQVLEGVDAMKAGRNQEKGAIAMVEALNAYGAHFDHPGWKALGEF